MPFTEKMQAFIDFKAAGATHEEAACSAGYAIPSASVTASKLMKRDDVRAAVAKAKRELSKAQPAGVDIPGELDPWKLKDRYSLPLDLLLDVLNNPKAPTSLRIQCAKDAMPYCHARKEGTKGDEKKSKSKDAAGGAFKSQPMPTRLRQVA
jgi:phage terminase small subunit